MKPTITILLLVLAVTATLAQNKVQASEIIRQINEGRAVEYTNSQIEGDLDFTNLKNSRLEHSSRWGDDETWESEVEVTVSFTNCTFLGDVLAYYHIDRKDATYIAHFEKDVLFKNCTFSRMSEFKYSEFGGTASFAGSTFDREGNFKYAEFSQGPVFTEAKFDNGADFKYTEFPRETTFEKAKFRGLANFKYSKFRSPLNMDNTEFNGSEDFKYTTIDGRNFTSYLLRK